MWMVGCGHERPVAEPPKPAANAVVKVARPATPTASASTAIPVAKRPNAVAAALPAPAERACSLSSTSWSGGLRVGPGKPVYGFVSFGTVTVSLGTDTRDGSAFVEAEKDRLRLIGAIEKPAIYTKAATTLASFVTPLADTPLGWQPTDVVGRVGITLDVSEVFEVPNVVETTVSCDKLTLDEPQYHPLGAATETAVPAAMIGGGVDLSLSPGLPPVARTKQNEYQEVFVLEKRGLHMRVAIKATSFYAVGWVPSAAVTTRGAGIGGGGRGVGIGFGTSNRRGCKRELELIAEVDGARAIVGTLLIGGGYTASTPDEVDGYTAITLAATWFQPAPGARVLVRTQDLAGC